MRSLKDLVSLPLDSEHFTMSSTGMEILRMSSTGINDADEDEDDSGTYGQVLGGASSGSIGQQIGQRIAGGSNSAQGVASQQNGQTAGGVTWPNVSGSATGSLTYGTTTTASATGSSAGAGQFSITPTGTKVTWNGIGQLSSLSKTVTKKKVRYVIVKQDKSCIELKELNTITPEEMIGISKFMSLVSTYVVLVLGQAVMTYNFNISWSDLIQSLNISKHFAPGLALDEYDKDASEVLDILLYDPQ